MRARIALATGLLALVAAPALHSSAASVTKCTPDAGHGLPWACVHYNDSACFVCVDDYPGEPVETTSTFVCRTAPYPVSDYLRNDLTPVTRGSFCQPGHG